MIKEVMDYLKISDLEYSESKSDDGLKKWTVQLPDSFSYSKIFSILDADADAIEISDEESYTEDQVINYYESVGCAIKLTADLKNDKYKLEIEELK